MMDTATPPPAAHPHPPAGGRSDGPQAGAPGSDRRGIGLREARYATQPGQPVVIARCTCATGVQAARRHPGDVAARRHSWTRRALLPARIPLRAPAIAATDDGYWLRSAKR
jgi:hypothetical protein